MRFIREEISGKNTTRYMFALGKEEAKIMLGLLTRSVKHLPKMLSTMPLEGKMNSMIRTITEALPDIQPDTKPIDEQ